MTISFKIDTKPLEEFARRIRKIKLIDLRNVERELIQAGNEAVALNFDTQGAAAGRRWQKLAPSTIADRRRRGFPAGPPLQRTGALRKAATDLKAVTTEKLAVLAMRDPKLLRLAKFQQLGTGRIPPRPFIVINAPFVKRVSEIFQLSIERSLKEQFK